MILPNQLFKTALGSAVKGMGSGWGALNFFIHEQDLLPLQNLTPLQYSTPTLRSKTQLNRLHGTQQMLQVGKDHKS